MTLLGFLALLFRLVRFARHLPFAVPPDNCHAFLRVADVSYLPLKSRVRLSAQRQHPKITMTVRKEKEKKYDKRMEDRRGRATRARAPHMPSSVRAGVGRRCPSSLIAPLVLVRPPFHRTPRVQPVHGGAYRWPRQSSGRACTTRQKIASAPPRTEERPLRAVGTRRSAGSGFSGCGESPQKIGRVGCGASTGGTDTHEIRLELPAVDTDTLQNLFHFHDEAWECENEAGEKAPSILGR
jgi:hypothetical protein